MTTDKNNNNKGPRETPENYKSPFKHTLGPHSTRYLTFKFQVSIQPKGFIFIFHSPLAAPQTNIIILENDIEIHSQSTSIGFFATKYL